MKKYLSFRGDFDIFDLIGQDFWILVKCRHAGLKYIQIYSYFEKCNLLNCMCVEPDNFNDPVTNAWRVDEEHWYGFYQFHPWQISIVKPIEMYTTEEIKARVLSGKT